MLSIKKIFYLQEKQKELDSFIQENFVKRNNVEYYDYQGFLPSIKLSLFVEIGELANEAKTFKYWKKNITVDWKKVKEELIDCLHFFLSLSNFFEIDFSKYKKNSQLKEKKTLNDFLLELFSKTESIPFQNIEDKNFIVKKEEIFYSWINTFEKICDTLGINEMELIKIYEEKNQKNRLRQSENY